MSKQLTILLAPLDAVGPVNACIGIGEVLKDRGHRIVFAVGDTWRGKLEIYGFQEEIIVLEDSNTIEDPAKHWADFIQKCGLFGSKSPIDKVNSLLRYGFEDLINTAKASDPILKEIVERIKPDIILTEPYVWMPSLMNCGIPWAVATTNNPLWIDFFVDDEKIVPSCLGLPTNGDQKEWKTFREQKKEALRDLCESFHNWLELKGFPPLPKDKLVTPSPYLNLYMYPEELDYKDILPSNWHRFDCFTRSGNLDSFEIPEKLRTRTGKLIFLSMGSMGGTDVELMKKFVSILSKSEHRIIVSKGPLSDQYELADNMWGERTVPQIKVLPIVDLVITHGGNNTLTETFFFGKPMIVMPLFFDQYDNAQRIQEKGFGIRLDPYDFTETQLLESIDTIIKDENLTLKMKKISERIQTSKSIIKVAELIENLVK